MHYHRTTLPYFFARSLFSAIAATTPRTGTDAQHQAAAEAKR